MLLIFVDDPYYQMRACSACVDSPILAYNHTHINHNWRLTQMPWMVETKWHIVPYYRHTSRPFYVIFVYRRYIPVLNNMPNQYIHEPWLAPESIQFTANCIIGIDYPLPIVNHVNASKINLERMKLAYQQLSNCQPQLENGKLILISSLRR